MNAVRPATVMAGMLTGPAAWAVSTQLGPILPYTECALAWPVSGMLAIGLALLSLVAGFWPWWRTSSDSPAGTVFVVGLGRLMGLLFGFALVLQAASSFLLDPCAH
jgi:hypothetical protein